MIRWPRLQVLCVALLVLVTVAGCSNNKKVPSKGSAPEGDDAELGKLAPADSGDEVDPVCSELTESRYLVDLPAAFSRLAGDDRTSAAQDLKNAAAELRQINEPELRKSSQGAADALDRMAKAGVTEATANEVAESLDLFGEEVQRFCKFPLG